MFHFHHVSFSSFSDSFPLSTFVQFNFPSKINEEINDVVIYGLILSKLIYGNFSLVYRNILANLETLNTK